MSNELKASRFRVNSDVGFCLASDVADQIVERERGDAKQ